MKNKQNNYIKKHTQRRDFTIISNDLINNYGDILWAKDKALLFYLLSRPEGWKVHVSDLITHFKDGKDAIYSGLTNLVKHGFISRTITKNEKATFQSFEYHVFDNPRENYIRDYAHSLEQDKNLKELYGIERFSPLPENPDVDESQEKSGSSPLPENPDMDNPNTDNPNTDNPNTDNPDIINTDSNKTYSLYADYPNFVSFMETYPEPRRGIQTNSCFEEWIKQGLEYHEHILYFIMQVGGYAKLQIKEKTATKYIKTPLNFLKEKMYMDDYIIKLNRKTGASNDYNSNTGSQNQPNNAESEEELTFKRLQRQLSSNA